MTLSTTSTSLEAAIDAVCRGEHGDPFAILGPHRERSGTVVRAFLPDAARAWLVPPGDGGEAREMRRVRAAGFFVGEASADAAERYRIRIDRDGTVLTVDDPYRFPPILGEMDAYLIAEGNHWRLHEVLGAHPRALDGVPGVAFAVWAPGASRVSVVGDFNAWDGRRHPMRLRRECGVWELFVPGLEPGAVYKFEIKDAAGHQLPLKADPLAFQSERRPATASVVHGLPSREWRDDAWMARRAAAGAHDAPISIYEVHLGSWMRVPDEGHRFLTYAELAERLVPYVRDMGFTHVELLPIQEHPFDGSWGYQPVGLFAPTSRFGTPEDFALLIESFHAAGIGVLLDWVPGHFPTDAHGLARLDGTALYEHADPRQGYHLDWNTLIYNFGRREVSNFLLDNALFWLDRYHIDGLRVDAVASMLYLDYSRPSDQWVPNRYGGNENLEAIALLRRLNELAYAGERGAITVAEESTAWPGVSQPTYLGGLGFGYKWNMGWMHDTLRYIGKDPVHRRWHHHDLSFGLLYAFSENFVLPISHDEVVHGKGSLLGRMPGDRWEKHANLRAYLGFMFAHPGKKLLFMGCEIAQEREWNFDASLDWHLLDDPLHGGTQRLVRDLNRLYRETPALHQRDCRPAGFEWIEAGDVENSVLTFLRRGEDADAIAVAVCNFTSVPRHGYRIGVPMPGAYRVALNTDLPDYGGSGVGDAQPIETEPVAWHGRPFSLPLTLPPLGTVILERIRD